MPESRPRPAWRATALVVPLLVFGASCASSAVPADLSSTASAVNPACIDQLVAPTVQGLDECCQRCSAALNQIVPGVTGWAEAHLHYRIFSMLAVIVFSVALGFLLARARERAGKVSLRKLAGSFFLPALAGAVLAGALEGLFLNAQAEYLLGASDAWDTMYDSVSANGDVTCPASIDVASPSGECMANEIIAYPGAYTSYGPLRDDGSSRDAQMVDRRDDLLLFMRGTPEGQAVSTAYYGREGTVLRMNEQFRSAARARLGPLWLWPWAWPIGALLGSIAVALVAGISLHLLLARRRVAMWRSRLKAPAMKALA